MNRQNRFLNRTTTKYTLAGVMFGFVFPIVGSIARVIDLGLGISLASLAAVQSTDSLLWIIDTAPLFLGLLAGIAAYRQEMLEKSNRGLVLAERELHAGFPREKSRRKNARSNQCKSNVDKTC